jgi:hypothetical protein
MKLFLIYIAHQNKFYIPKFIDESGYLRKNYFFEI